MREPGAGLAPVHAERLEPPEQVVRELGSAAALVVEGEHPDAAGLAVAAQREARPPGSGCGVAQRGDDAGEVAGGPGAQEGEGDVEVPGRHDPAAELPLLPADDPLDDVAGQPERAEEPEPLIARDATGRRVACLCQLCVKSRRTRCSAATAARERIASRSAG